MAQSVVCICIYSIYVSVFKYLCLYEKASVSCQKQNVALSCAWLTTWKSCENTYISFWTISNQTNQLLSIKLLAPDQTSSGKKNSNKEDFEKSGQGQISSFLAPLVFSYSSLNQRAWLSSPTNYLIRRLKGLKSLRPLHNKDGTL